MNIMDMATSLFMEKIGGQGDSDSIAGALTSLLSDSDGNLNIMSLVGRFQSSDITSLVTSWLGNGENNPISMEKVSEIFGENSISEFASNSNLDVDTALQGLSGMIPDLIDQMSGEGAILENMVGTGGLANAAKSFFH